MSVVHNRLRELRDDLGRPASPAERAAPAAPADAAQPAPPGETEEEALQAIAAKEELLRSGIRQLQDSLQAVTRELEEARRELERQRTGDGEARRRTGVTR